MNYNCSIKKRKANGGEAVVLTDGAHDDVNTKNNDGGGGFMSSWFGYLTGRGDNASSRASHEGNKSQLDRMENVMTRMEEKLATVRSLESRCKQLEAKCSSLENMLQSTSKSTMNQLKYNEMLIRNQSWKYSAPVPSMQDLLYDYDDDEAEYICLIIQSLKTNTVDLRRGKFRDVYNGDRDDKGLTLFGTDRAIPLYDSANHYLIPHWKEFATALEDFTPAFHTLPDGIKTSISFDCGIQLNQEATQLVMCALRDKPFMIYRFRDHFQVNGGMSSIASMMRNNRYLKKLDLENLGVARSDIVALCSAIHSHPSLVGVILKKCFSRIDGCVDEMLQLLLTDELKLEELNLDENYIGGGDSSACRLLSEYLSRNPRLTDLHLNNNRLNDRDAELLADGLRNNSTLTFLDISENNYAMGNDGKEALRMAICNQSSLNAIADSNHTCTIENDDIDYENKYNEREMSRARKMWRLLSCENKTLLQNFVDIDVLLLPNALEAVQKYSSILMENGYNDHESKAISTVYEIMRKWDKAMPLFDSLDKSVN